MAGKFFRVAENRIRKVSPGKTRKSQFAKSHLEVRMFNVGGGEAILLVFPGKRAWLVDCGSGSGDRKNETLGTRLAEYLAERGLVLEALIPSHPHKDHGGAFGWLLFAGPTLAGTVTLYRSDTPSWDREKKWIAELWEELARLGSGLEEVALTNAHREVRIADGVEAHLFAGSGAGAYTSLFLHLRFHQARLLFTGDSYCRYELKLLESFGDGDFRSDVLKVTHHGSSSGTAQGMVDAVKPGIAIVSTAADGGHRLEKDTLKRLGGHKRPRRVFETHVDGDIILRTDGGAFGDGILYQVEFEEPGRFESALGAATRSLTTVNKERTTSKHSACE